MSQAEEFKEKIAIEEKERNRKIAALKKLDTSGLVAMIPDLEDKLEAVLREENTFRDLNTGFLSSGTSDCSETKRLLAELAVQAEGKNKEERDAWLTLQRKSNAELDGAIKRQQAVAFELNNLQTGIEMARKRLDNILRVLSLRTAQIKFLTSTS